MGTCDLSKIIMLRYVMFIPTQFSIAWPLCLQSVCHLLGAICEIGCVRWGH